jgi:hypothetical protein
VPIGEIFSKSIQIIWNHKLLILFGFLASLATFVINLVLRLIFESFLLLDFPYSNLDSFFNQLPSEYAAWITGGFILLFVGFVVAWIINTIAEGALIRGISGSRQGIDLTFGQAWTAGVHLLKQFIAIDTILFLPVFLILLLIMLIVFGTLVALILAGLNPGISIGNLLTIGSAGSVVTVPLACALIPVIVLVYLLRIFAFREVALADRNSVESIRNALQMIWTMKGPIAILALMLWALRYAARLPFQLLSLLLIALSLTIPFSAPAKPIPIVVLTLSGVMIAVSTWVIGSVLVVYTSAVWTLAFEEFLES